MITWENYRVADPDALVTPAMLQFQDMVDHNIRSACELAGGAGSHWSHDDPLSGQPRN